MYFRLTLSSSDRTGQLSFPLLYIVFVKGIARVPDFRSKVNTFLTVRHQKVLKSRLIFGLLWHETTTTIRRLKCEPADN